MIRILMKKNPPRDMERWGELVIKFTLNRIPSQNNWINIWLVLRFIDMFLIKIIFRSLCLLEEIISYVRNEWRDNFSLQQLIPWEVLHPWVIFNFVRSTEAKTAGLLSLNQLKVSFSSLYSISEVCSLLRPPSWNFI